MRSFPLPEQVFSGKGSSASSWTPSRRQWFSFCPGCTGTHTLWLAEEPVTIRRCSVSFTVKGESVRLRLDCQRGEETPQPSAAQCAQLAQLCTQTVQSFWQQGIDLVHLQQRSALQYGVGREKITIKNDCPQLQTVVRFLPE